MNLKPIITGVALYLLSAPVFALEKNGFTLDDALVPGDEILHGGPPRDGIPAIDQPVFHRANKAVSLQDSDRILGIHRHGISKAYPINILNWHEIVNDSIGEEQIIVTYCPLCGTGIVFAVPQADTKFGVSGLLYNSDVLLYDRKTESLWSQIMAKAISGALKGQRLQGLASTHTTWQDWRQRHPDTLVLTTNTGYERDYQRNPYADYANQSRLYYPVSNSNKRYHPKEQVLGLIVDGQTKVYPFAELAKAGHRINDVINNKAIRIAFNAEHQTASVFDRDGHELPATIGYWFAWMVFYPQSEVFTAQ